jgi:hypothetical protein
MKAEYSVELLKESRDGFTSAGILARESDLEAARAMYKFCASQFSKKRDPSRRSRAHSRPQRLSLSSGARALL